MVTQGEVIDAALLAKSRKAIERAAARYGTFLARPVAVKVVESA
jgi:hypothetical protein